MTITIDSKIQMVARKKKNLIPTMTNEVQIKDLAIILNNLYRELKMNMISTHQNLSCSENHCVRTYSKTWRTTLVIPQLKIDVSEKRRSVYQFRDIMI